MSNPVIKLPEAVALATSAARRVLRDRFPKDETEVFESYIFEDKNFWLFFRNRKIVLPDPATGQYSDSSAVAIGKHGMVLTVRDNMDRKDELDRQVEGLSRYFELRDK